MKETVVYDCNF